MYHLFFLLPNLIYDFLFFIFSTFLSSFLSFLMGKEKEKKIIEREGGAGGGRSRNARELVLIGRHNLTYNIC